MRRFAHVTLVRAHRAPGAPLAPSRAATTAVAVELCASYDDFLASVQDCCGVEVLERLEFLDPVSDMPLALSRSAHLHTALAMLEAVHNEVSTADAHHAPCFCHACATVRD